MNSSMFRMILGISLVLFLGSGCEKQVARADYFPLKDGNRWEYRLLDGPLLKQLNKGVEIKTASSKSGNDAASKKASSSPIAETFELDSPPKVAKAFNENMKEQKEPAAEVINTLPEKTEKKQPVGSQKAKRVILELKEKRDELTYRATYGGFEQVWSKRDGYISFQDSRGRHYLLILPPHSSYRWVVTDEHSQNLYYEIEYHGELVTPAGIFPQCAVVSQESRDKRVVVRYWFAAETGLVRRSKFYNGEEIFRQELVAYSVRPSSPAGRKAEEKEIKIAMKRKKRGREFLRKDK